MYTCIYKIHKCICGYNIYLSHIHSYNNRFLQDLENRSLSIYIIRLDILWLGIGYIILCNTKLLIELGKCVSWWIFSRMRFCIWSSRHTYKFRVCVYPMWRQCWGGGDKVDPWCLLASQLRVLVSACPIRKYKSNNKNTLYLLSSHTFHHATKI